MAHTRWPDLAAVDLGPTAETLQLFSQVVGKVRLARTPWVNHSWHVTLRVSARGLYTPLIPHEQVSFDLAFDFVEHAVVIRVSDGGERRLALAGQSVAGFYAELIGGLAALGVPVAIDPKPNEMPEPTPFHEDRAPRAYDPEAAQAYWRALVQADRVLGRFRSRFLGKCSPVHIFWGGFDLAVTRFSGRTAPPHPGGVPHLSDAVTREAYSHEVSSAGFWPGGGGAGEPCFYAYAYPTPAGFAEALVPPPARWDPQLGEFLLPYAAVRGAADPDQLLLTFLQSTYAAAADLAGWDRASLECEEGRVGVPRAV